MPDNLWQTMILSGELGRHPVQFFTSTGSTNDLALILSNTGAPDGTLIVADNQTAGRGRLAGRIWLSPPGTGLYFSLILRPRLSPEDFPKLTLAAGLALCKALEGHSHCQPGLKWPNDIFLHGKKCGGILTETQAVSGAGQTAVVIGIGLNVNIPAEAFTGELRSKATSLLAETGIPHDRGPLLAAILAELDLAVARLEQGDFPAILTEWRQRDIHAGHQVSWGNTQGKIITGISLGPDDEGFLHIRDNQGRIHSVISGDISLAQE
ncbi:biotin--[acetyl-CoA-carboxylase] ligase [Thiovibrio frasassiensis]|uniref:biotin--[biotin carboxyl-carrier protein] ligase n=1 Tax=Thiovibrio frasassiensis TaxID=2984131 RepID=A0A9X4MM34_9BACT|nr:biotin--[acetyl-CoA-carboxylase] ligase [Thiovibrio frasassiensis]MDG4475307.1 biotin--[acetyl-CoA-carboxylase] ligase [Thiovibrio frasassiensis]